VLTVAVAVAVPVLVVLDDPLVTVVRTIGVEIQVDTAGGDVGTILGRQFNA